MITTHFDPQLQAFLYHWDLRYNWPAIVAVWLIGSIVALAVIPIVIRVQRKASIGQQVYDSGPAAHLVKQGTPTIGGLAFPIAAAAAAIFLRVINAANQDGWIVGFLIAAAAIGFADDFLKIKRRTALGLRARTKMLLLLIVAAFAAHWYVSAVLTNGYFFRGNTQEWWFGGWVQLPVVWYYILAICAVVGCANAVNLTDGVDGLAASVALPPLILFAILDGGGIALAVASAVAIFMFFNRHPARVFMGDTGSLALGGLLAFFALKLHLLLVLPLIGIVFVIEALSVIVQVVSFKLTGKRVFKMSPLHHHFELLGWAENKVVIVFAIVSLVAMLAFCAAVYSSGLTYMRVIRPS